MVGCRDFRPMYLSRVHTPSSLEITRLQNSISHLKRTQEELKEYADDEDIAQAIKENNETMSVQHSPLALLHLFNPGDMHTQSIAR